MFPYYFRTELAEREGMLRTKAMREREEMKERRKYRFALIRIRFPDGLVLQVRKKFYINTPQLYF